MLRKRLLIGTLFILATIIILAIDAYFFAHYYPFFTVGVAIMGWVAAGELAHLIQRLPLPVKPIFNQMGVALILVANWIAVMLGNGPSMRFSLWAFVAVGMLAFVWEAWEFRTPGKGSVNGIAGSLLVFFYVGILGAFFAQIRWLAGRPGEGNLLLFLTVFVVKGADMGAYFAGRFLGRTQMAPILSPKKTWEGFMGGMLAAQLVGAGCVWFCQEVLKSPLLTWPTTAVIAFSGAIVGPIGDLIESMIKRDCQQKDASDQIPGFGGILDIIDSVLFFAPVSYMLFHLLKVV